jgi:hypothetical protein
MAKGEFFCQTFEAAIQNLRKEILDEFRRGETKAGFRVVWEHFEDVINPSLIKFLKQPPLSIAEADITKIKSKSTYPDLKVRYRGNLYAIDVKSGEDHMDPWYDIGRLDTYEEKHLDKYAAEYSVVVRWKGRPRAEIVDVYLDRTFRTVGYREISGGVLYRPYDGKLRPKSWTYFERGKSYWNTVDEFRAGLIASRDFRRKSYVVEWYKEMNQKQRAALRADLNAVDAGKPVRVDDAVLEIGNE